MTLYLKNLNYFQFHRHLVRSEQIAFLVQSIKKKKEIYFKYFLIINIYYN